MGVHVWDTLNRGRRRRRKKKRKKGGDGMSTDRILLQDWCRAEGGGLKE